MSKAADSSSDEAMRVGDDLKPSYSDLSYADEIINYLWPAPYDNVYVELRENGPDAEKGAIDEC